MPPSLFSAALEAWRSGDASRALELCSAAVTRDSVNLEAHRLLAEMHSAAGRVAEAIVVCQRISELAPHDAANLRRLAVFFTQIRQPERAVSMLEQSLQIEPTNVRALNNLGSLQSELGNPAASVVVLQRALALQANYPVAIANLGASLLAVGRVDEAVIQFNRALALDGSLAPAYLGQGAALARLGRGEEAIAAYRRAAMLNPRDPRAFLQMGRLMLQLGFSVNALSAYTAALELLPGDLSAQEGRVSALMALKRHQDAIPAIAALRATAPWNHYLQGHQLHAQLNCADWSDYDASTHDITLRVRRGERVDLPLSFIVHNDSPADQLACASIFMADQVTAGVTSVTRSLRPSNHRLRVAYLSSDFGDHPVSQLILGVMEEHDRVCFETYAFATGGDDGSEMRHRVAARFDHFEPVGALGDQEIAERIAAAAVDIVVDLGGHTSGSRMPLLAFRPAGLQMSFLGFPGTTGADFIDYIIADRHVIPALDQQHYSEKVIYLPDSYLPAALPRATVQAPDRIAAGLPADGLVYCSFNAPHKISPRVFDSWMRILTAVPKSILWLRDAADVVKENLASEARARGVDSNRLVFAPRVATFDEHIARLALADLFLDTLPYNAHTSASDALAAAVPVLTMRGGSFASRVATSLLFACGLGELSTDSQLDYERRAVQLGHCPGDLASLKQHLLRARASAPLFDTARFCRNLEAAYLETWARHERGERPSALHLG